MNYSDLHLQQALRAECSFQVASSLRRVESLPTGYDSHRSSLRASCVHPCSSKIVGTLIYARMYTSMFPNMSELCVPFIYVEHQDRANLHFIGLEPLNDDIPVEGVVENVAALAEQHEPWLFAAKVLFETAH